MRSDKFTVTDSYIHLHIKTIINIQVGLKYPHLK